MSKYQRVEIRRSEILSAAMKLFSQKGFRATTMDDIAHETTIARTTLYDYFKSKEEMLFALIDKVVIQQRIVPPEGSIRKQLEILAAESLARVSDNYVLYKIFFQEMPSLSNQTAEKINEWQRHSMMLVINVIKNGIKKRVFNSHLSESDIAFMYRALVGQRLADLLTTNVTFDIENEARRLIDMLWHGAAESKK